MLGAGGIGLNNSLHAATRASGALSLNVRQTMVANAHGVQLGRLSRSAAAGGGGGTGQPLSEQEGTFLGRSLSETFIQNANVRRRDGGGCRRCLADCCAVRQPVDDDASFGRLSMSDVGQSVGEWSLLLWLAAPLLIGKLADEISTVGMIRLWGGLGTQSLAAANLAWTWLSFTLVLIQGVQQALYSIVPQAAGAEKGRAVSAMLTASMLWSCVLLLLPIAVGWLYLGEFIRYVEVGLENTNTNPNSTATMIDVDTIQSFSTASISWLLPFVAVSTLTNWLECLEIVSSVSAIAAVWTVARVFLAYLMMHPLGAGLNGYAFGFAVSCVGQLLSLLLVVFVWRKQHIEPQRWWFGVGCKEALSPALSRRLLVLSAPLALQAALASWHTTIYNMLMAEYNAEQVAGYGVSDALTGAGGSISLALYTATSIRVGMLLGEGRVSKAKVAARAGMIYAVAFAVVCGVGLSLMARPLSVFFSPLDTQVQDLIEDAIVPVAGYYTLESLKYGLWAVLEGQARVKIATASLVAGHWLVSVPTGFYMLRYYIPNHCEIGFKFSRFACPYWWEASPLEIAWWCNAMGSLATVLVMAVAIACSNWEKLAEEAKEELAQLDAGDGSESDLDGDSGGGSPGMRAHEESVRLATMEGEHWLGSTAALSGAE